MQKCLPVDLKFTVTPDSTQSLGQMRFWEGKVLEFNVGRIKNPESISLVGGREEDGASEGEGKSLIG